jgi:hypothetical protein
LNTPITRLPLGQFFLHIEKTNTRTALREVAVHLTAKPAWYRDRPRTLNELKTAITAYTRNISQADLQKVFANKIKLVQACINARGHHFQHHV